MIQIGISENEEIVTADSDEVAFWKGERLRQGEEGSCLEDSIEYWLVLILPNHLVTS